MSNVKQFLINCFVKYKHLYLFTYRIYKNEC